MKKLLFALLFAAVPAKAGLYYNLSQTTSAATLGVGGDIYVASVASDTSKTHISSASVTATTFYGNGSNLTGIPSSATFTQKASSGTNADIFAFTGTGFGLSIATAATFTSTVTISTYSPSGYSLSLSSGITLNGCINFPNGRQCGAAGSGTGDVIAANSNNFTNTNTFASSTTIKGGLFMNGSGLGVGWYVPVASGVTTTISTLTLTGIFTASNTYILDVQYWIGNAGVNVVPYMVFNQSGVTPFSTAAIYTFQNSGAANGTACSSGSKVKYAPLGCETGTAQASPAGGRFIADIYTVFRTSTTVGWTSRSGEQGTSQSVYISGVAAGQALLSSVLTDVEVFFAAINEGGGNATFDAKWFVYKRME